MDKQSQIVIVGAGVFGLSTALELSKRGFQNITVLDRHVPPVLEAQALPCKTPARLLVLITTSLGPGRLER